MTREQDFLARWQADQHAYRAWGEHVSQSIEEALTPLIAPTRVDYFLRTAVKPRLKDGAKLVEKAFYRNKNYSDPYTDITDKVGTRFVVLLGRDIQRVVEAVNSFSGWTISKDRDYEEEQKENPIAFDYAAIHFVVRPDEEIEHNGVLISPGTPCEVQIKTLLQHAYSELTHDTIYKPQINATSSMRRNAAKAMALLEATNDYFEKVQDEVEDALTNVREMTANLTSIYQEFVGCAPKPSILEGLILEAYEANAGEYIPEIRNLLERKSYLIPAIQRRIQEQNPIFFQPSVLLVYLEIDRSPRLAQSLWPLTPREQRPLLNDLGESDY